MKGTLARVVRKNEGTEWRERWKDEGKNKNER